MRYLVFVVLLAVGIFAISRPEVVLSVAHGARSSLHDFQYEKEIKVSGLHLLTEESFLSLLPTDKSVWWWIINSAEIRKAASVERFVASTEIEPCSSLYLPDWGCFRIRVDERRPSYVAIVDGAAWVLGEDGGFLGRVPGSRSAEEFVRDEKERFGPLRILRGLSIDSPDGVRAKFQYAEKALSIIEQESGLEAEWVELQKNGELKIKFNPYPFVATFDFAEEDWRELRLEAERLKKLLNEFRGREQQIKLIDLAYQKMAVVKLFPH